MKKLYWMLIILISHSLTAWASELSQEFCIEEINNAAGYGLKVYAHMSPSERDAQDGTVSQQKTLVIDVEKSYKTDPHSLQKALNYADDLYGYFFARPYNLPQKFLAVMLHLMTRKTIGPTTSDVGPFTNAWHIYDIWLGHGGFTPGAFKTAFPTVSRIKLVTTAGRPVLLSGSNHPYLVDLRECGIQIL